MKSDLSVRVENLEHRIKRCVIDECEILRKTANPQKEFEKYIRNIRWNNPELAAYLKKEMSALLNFDD